MARMFFIILLLALMVTPALAQEEQTVTFGDIRFQFSADLGNRLEILNYDVPVEEYPLDAPSTQFYFVEQVGIDRFDRGALRVYDIETLAASPELSVQVDLLRRILEERPDLSTFETPELSPETVLPYLPLATHGQVLRAGAEYVETESVRGIRYIAGFLAAAEPFTSTSFQYVFQGISADGQRYISATFGLTTDLFPAELPAIDMEQFMAEQAAYLSESIATLDQAAPEAFTPSLAALDALVGSVGFVEGGVRAEAVRLVYMTPYPALGVAS